MIAATLKSHRRPKRLWNEREYLKLADGRHVEFDYGVVEVQPMPTETHQIVVFNLHSALHQYVRSKKLGRVLAAPFPVKVAELKYHEPDVLFRRKPTGKSNPDKTLYWDDVSLVIEVISRSSKNRKRDQIEKRIEYAAAGIAEYWLVDLAKSEITVLTLGDEEEKYSEAGRYGLGDVARSVVLPGFKISVDFVFDTTE